VLNPPLVIVVNLRKTNRRDRRVTQKKKLIGGQNIFALWARI